MLFSVVFFLEARFEGNIKKSLTGFMLSIHLPIRNSDVITKPISMTLYIVSNSRYCQVILKLENLINFKVTN